MKILRAEHMGMCFGVRDAIALAKERSQNGGVTVLGELVHNRSVQGELERRGVKIEKRVEAVVTRDVMITAHGTSERELERIRGRGLNVIEATCPLVRHAHDSVKRLAEAGYHPVIVGKRDHVEVRGLTGDLDAYDVVLSKEDVAALAPCARFGVAAQTTQPLTRVEALVDELRRQFPDSEVKFVDTVCGPTKQRQAAAAEMARAADAVVVIGGANSNNTRELVSVCGRHCDCVHHVQTAADLEESWFEGAETVGVTAGTSTPDDTIAEVEAWLTSINERLAASTAPVAPVGAMGA
jgi:4-hydroxy-3-methylbut-2-enyl diphosphate reductase